MIELEHFSPESTDQFGVRWWSDLQHSISDDYAEDSEDWQFARGYVTSVPAYIVGLFGLDCEHGCVTELHPIYGMALRSVARRPAREPQFDRWAFFARNAGSEGFCSTGQLLNYGYEYLSLLARPPKDQPFTDIVIKGWWVVNHPATSGVTVSVVKVAEGVVIVVRFPPGDNSYEMIEGEVVFQWL